MTYSVNWIPTDTKFSRRFDVYLDHRFFEHQVPVTWLNQFYNIHIIFHESHVLVQLYLPLKLLSLFLHVPSCKTWFNYSPCCYESVLPDTCSRTSIFWFSVFLVCYWNSFKECLPFFFLGQVHWFSIFNSLVMVVFLAGLVSKILMRTLCTEDGKHAREDIDLGLLVINSCLNKICCENMYYTSFFF